ncbi:hypothetical protein DLAC_01499 [Tieghemostelium lacteum]|uniref:NIF3-like protein 1 n=1 Tax=Tieghemostelium lacteum TaxID=361077 RepID=A0A152A5K5_TIELA|nr:hypothetical protein DLAC_01499 [Tieghemostelium lacteum]|eukprot:KYR01510.1 hypothetical protein DLAC_01499 [Tieghemostelium lacteum]
MTSSTKGIKFSEIIKTLNQNYPLSLAEKWDNVGVLVENSDSSEKMIENVFLTIDLTEPVLQEAIDKKSDFIITYHPPLFASFKQVTQKSASQRIATKAIENKIPIYSPHSILDSVENGMNDWIAKGLLKMTEGKGQVRPIQPVQDSVNTSSKYSHKLTVYTQIDKEQKLVSSMTLNVLTNFVEYGKIEYGLQSSQISETTEKLSGELKDFIVGWELKPFVEKLSSSEKGAGRFVTLSKEVTIEEAVKCVKSLFNMEYIRLAKPLDGKTKGIKTISLCAGSGGMLIFNEKADLYLTGELKHHEILDANAKGSYVIVCDHSNSERGYLPEYKSALSTLFKDKLNFTISTLDKDPLSIV